MRVPHERSLTRLSHNNLHPPNQHFNPPAPSPPVIKNPEIINMPSPAQYAANRLNAVKSTGPATPKGKVRSSLNALRHGLTARVVILPTEDMAAYQAFSKEIVDSLDARTPVERQFAQTVADNQWRINRIRSIEDGMLAEAHFEDSGDFDAEHADIHSALTASRAFRDHSKEFVNLSLYEQRLQRSLREALRQLHELQAMRRERMTGK